MRKLVRHLLMLIVSLTVYTNCTTSLYDHGRAFLRNENYEQAIEIFRIQLKTEPDNYKLWRDVGIAYYRNGKKDSASVYLKKAHEINPKDGTTIYYLGTVHQEKGDYAQAIRYFQQYTEVGRLSGIRRKIKENLKLSIRELYRQKVRQAIKTESTLSSLSDSTIAVLYFDNLGANTQLDPLQKGLAEVLSYYLSKIEALRVLERMRLQVILEELKLTEEEKVDIRTAPRVGKLLGAKTLVKGSFLDSEESNQIRIDASLIDSQTGELKTSSDVTGSLDDFVRLQKDIVRRVVDDLNIPLTDAELEAFEPPTHDRVAFMAFSEGLSYEDRGNFAEALEQYNLALSFDPNFQLAEDQANRLVSGLTESLAPEKTKNWENEVYKKITAEDKSATERLNASGAQVNAGVVRGQDERDALQEATGQDRFDPVPVEVEIPIPQN